MRTESSNVSAEIDAIIQRAMQEYAEAKGIDPFVENEPTADEEAAAMQEAEEADPLLSVGSIPVNSASILVEETTSRFSSAIWYDNIKSKVITLAGVGGIGSYVAFLLARMQPERLIIYDDDVVEAANMSGQLYGTHSVGRTKVSSIADMIADYAAYYEVITFPERFTMESEATDIMICGFDNMAARRLFFGKWQEHVTSLPIEDRKKCLFIDGRLAAESLQVLCITGDDVFSQTKYEGDYLFRDDEADETICSYKQTTFMANMIGSLIVNLFVNFCANECNPLIPRDLPFFTEYTAETMYFKVIA